MKVSAKANVLNATFGGVIEIEDFNTYQPNKKRIGNQVTANHLEHLALKQKETREKEALYKNMVLEELRKKKIISNTNGRPCSSLTDEKWQKELDVRKLYITPVPKGTRKLCGKCSIESGFWTEDTRGVYDGTTNWQSYCSYINDVLNNIRAGQIDCCYYIYQITDLLRFHFDDLKTKYCDGYWMVWLEK